jgi:(p)ppGpp synthase/HD superfamily hydrolase
MNNSNIISSAKRFAREAHKEIIITTVSGDKRPQVEHLQEVADLVWVSGGNDIEIAAAWLHDSVEDTAVTLEDIEKNFGKEITAIVYGLTDLDEIKNLPTNERKAKQAERVKDENESVKRIKIADQTSNIRFVTTDPKETWSFEGNRNYAIGAKQIADNCKGISPVLDELFDREYRKAAEHFKI